MWFSMIVGFLHIAVLYRWQYLTCLAANLIGPVIFTVIKEVAPQVGTDAFSIAALELFFIACGCVVSYIYMNHVAQVI